jgi:hypothetical protein
MQNLGLALVRMDLEKVDMLAIEAQELHAGR